MRCIYLALDKLLWPPPSLMLLFYYLCEILTATPKTYYLTYLLWIFALFSIQIMCCFYLWLLVDLWLPTSHMHSTTFVVGTMKPNKSADSIKKRPRYLWAYAYVRKVTQIFFIKLFYWIFLNWCYLRQKISLLTYFNAKSFTEFSSSEILFFK